MTPKEQEFLQLAQMLNNPWFALLLSVMIVWTLIWKGFALWKAAKNSSLAWFMALLVFNTVGILEIVYIFFFSKKKVLQ
jgi:hypothetical protein